MTRKEKLLVLIEEFGRACARRDAKEMNAKLKELRKFLDESDIHEARDPQFGG